MNILHLNLKKKWYDMIDSGEKKEEYREIKDHWKVRLMASDYEFKRFDQVTFALGYTRQTISFEVEGISIGIGKKEWGAPSCPVYIIKLGKRLN